MSTTTFTKTLAAGAVATLLALFTVAGATPAYAAEVLPVYQHASEAAADSGSAEVLPVYQLANDAAEANAGVPIAEVAASAEVLPVYDGNAAVAIEASHASGVQPMGVEGAPLMHALDEFGGWMLPLAAVGAAMLIALAIFGLKMLRNESRGQSL